MEVERVASGDLVAPCYAIQQERKRVLRGTDDVHVSQLICLNFRCVGEIAGGVHDENVEQISVNQGMEGEQ